LNSNGTYRSNVFFNTIGPEYITIAFETAAAADPCVKLYYNDFGIESTGAKATAAQNLVKSLKARGIKIDGVGLQAHFIVGKTSSLAAQTANLESFIALGVEVAYTELDIRFLSLPPSDSAIAQQSTDYYNTVGACIAAGDSCVGITLWDFMDKFSWVPNTFPGQGEALPWDANLNKKPAYYAIVSALGGTATTSAVSSPTSTTSATATSTGGAVLQHNMGSVGA
jgi:endo-1,4-beta-xylanase